MKKMKWMMGVLSLTIATSAFAKGGGIGNGGDAVECDGGKNVYLLDYIEGKTRKFNYKDENSQESVRVLAMRAFDSLIQKMDFRGYAYRNMLEEILNDVEAFNGSEYLGKQVAFTFDILPDVPDSKELSIPANCTKPQQLVVQRQSSEFPEDQEKLRNFRIYIPLWLKLNNFQKAMTITHELLFWDQIEDDAPDSRGARYLNETLLSDRFEGLTSCEWLKKLKMVSAKNFFGIGLYLQNAGVDDEKIAEQQNRGRENAYGRNTIAGMIATNQAECVTAPAKGSDSIETGAVTLDYQRNFYKQDLARPDVQYSQVHEMHFFGNAELGAAEGLSIKTFTFKSGVSTTDYVIIDKNKTSVIGLRSFAMVGAFPIRLNPKDSILNMTLNAEFAQFESKTEITDPNVVLVEGAQVGSVIDPFLTSKKTFWDFRGVITLKNPKGLTQYIYYYGSQKERPRDLKRNLVFRSDLNASFDFSNMQVSLIKNR